MSTSIPEAAYGGSGLLGIARSWQILTKHWYPVTLAREVDASRPVAAKLLDELLVVYRSGDKVVVAKRPGPR